MREMRVSQGVPLEEVFQLYESESKLYRGRPEMLVMRMRTNGRNVQLFRGGKVQILGPIAQKEAETMRREIILRLRRVEKMRMCQVTALSITNMVASLQLPSVINLRNIPYSNRDLSYEVELFPAALIRKWHPIHVALFHNGKMIVTGVKEVAVLKTIFKRALKFVSENHL
jgi:TATA-box binding protein (TBP) (component of TFIID and TFIIIB)